MLSPLRWKLSAQKRTTGIRLEEVESTTVSRNDAWLITLSMYAPEGPNESIVARLAGAGKREYKRFTVIKSDGDVRSMKIRELASV